MPKDDRNFLVFIHGFLGGTNNFDDLSERLGRDGYHVILDEYDTLDGGVEYHADNFVSKIMDQAKDANRVDIVTHSMGALLLRQYLSKHEVPKLGRVVMIAPANHGSEVADRMSERDWWVSMFGDAGLDLRTCVDFPMMPKGVEFGVIAGNASYNPISKDWIPCDDDGWVGVKSTKLEGMTDFIEVSSSHGTLTENESVIDQTAYFLHHGHFAANIEMVGTEFDVNSLDKLRDKSDQYMEKMANWYREIFDEGDEESIAEARKDLRPELQKFAGKLQKWSKDYLS